MATKIGYVGKDPSEQINWAEVGANFSGILKEEARVREEKKAEIDRSTREMLRTLDDAVTGDSANMNNWSLEYAEKAQQQLLMSNALLKNGQLKPKDYTMIRQNLSDGTDQAMTLAQEYQNEYSVKMARAKANPGTTIGPDGEPITGSQELESFLMASSEGFGNFNKSQLVINNKTGRVLVGFINPTTGQLESDPNKLVGINNLRNRIKGKYDAYDITSAVTKAKTEVFGQFTTINDKMGSLYQKGKITSISGPAFRSPSNIKRMIEEGLITEEESKLLGLQAETEDRWAESQLANVYNVSSLLTNNLGGFAPNKEKYTFTWNADEEDENTILLKEVDGNVVPDFDSEIGKKNRQIAKEGLITVLRGALDVGVGAQAIGGVQRSRSTGYGGGRGRTPEQETEYNLQLDWNGLYSMNSAERNTRLASMANTPTANRLGIQRIDIIPAAVGRGSERVQFVYSDGDVADINMDFENMTEQEWADAGSVFSGSMNSQQRLETGGFGGGFYNSKYQSAGVIRNAEQAARFRSAQEAERSSRESNQQQQDGRAGTF